MRVQPGSAASVSRSPTIWVTNALLTALPDEDWNRLLPNLEPIFLRHNEVIYQCDQTIRHVYLPEQCLISVLADLQDGTTVQVVAIGNPGFFGVPLALGSKIARRVARVEIPGTAIRMSAEAFLTEMERHGSFARTIHRYIQCRVFALAQSVACNRAHSLNQRLARLLLTAHDRIGSAAFSMTHEFMAGMLGSPRSEVSKALAIFRRARFIDYSRSTITIVRRKGLEVATCECYWAVAEELKRVFNVKATPRALAIRPRNSEKKQLA